MEEAVWHWLIRTSERISALIRGGPRSLHLYHQVRAKDKLAIRYPMATTSDYYQHIHHTNDAYKTNNWLVSEIHSVLSISPRSILEVGCGNGRFLAAVKGHVELAIGVDWARSPILDE